MSGCHRAVRDTHGVLQTLRCWGGLTRRLWHGNGTIDHGWRTDPVGRGSGDGPRRWLASQRYLHHATGVILMQPSTIVLLEPLLMDEISREQVVHMKSVHGNRSLHGLDRDQTSWR